MVLDIIVAPTAAAAPLKTSWLFEIKFNSASLSDNQSSFFTSYFFLGDFGLDEFIVDIVPQYNVCFVVAGAIIDSFGHLGLVIKILVKRLGEKLLSTATATKILVSVTFL